MSSAQPTESELANLRWMARVNPDGIGLYGPTVKKFGPLPECEALVARGWAKRRNDVGQRGGYWITAAGRNVIASGFFASEPRPRRLATEAL